MLIAYLFSWHTTADTIRAQTAAFAAWMIGHVVLAGHMRSERTPLLPRGLLANRLYLGWALGAGLTLLLSLTLPPFTERFHLTRVGAAEWAVVVSTAILLPYWWEIWKRIQLFMPAVARRPGR